VLTDEVDPAPWAVRRRSTNPDAGGARVVQAGAMTDVVAVLAALVFLGLAVLHLAWAAGSPWPARTAAELHALVVGGKPRSAMPPAWASVGVAIVLALFAGGGLAVRGLVPAPAPDVVRILTWIAAGIVVARGVGGFVEPWLRPNAATQPFARWNRRLYSPLCLVLAAALVA
jgi:hypothetical protein